MPGRNVAAPPGSRPELGRRAGVLLVLAVLAGVFLAGCLETGPSAFSANGNEPRSPTPSSLPTQTAGPSATPSPTTSTEPQADPSPSSTPEPAEPSNDTNGTGNETQNGTQNGTGNGMGNDTGNDTGNGADPDAPVVQWPALNDARVRPGVQILVQGAQCTSNFLFRSATNGTLYLGLAAHCVDSVPIGTSATVRDINGATAFQGKVAYSSWHSIGFVPEATSVGDDVHAHDFALVALPGEHTGVVHPAVLHFGGPVAMADYDAVALGSRVIVHGNSGLYPRPQPLDEQEGVVLRKGSEAPGGSAGYFVDTHMLVAPVPGDSGSGLMTKDGQALGALSTISAGTPYGVWWRYSSVPHALEHLDRVGWHLELQTWDLLEPGLLP